MVVQEVGYDDDCDEDLREAIVERIGTDLLGEDQDDVVDVVLLWFREDDVDWPRNGPGRRAMGATGRYHRRQGRRQGRRGFPRCPHASSRLDGQKQRGCDRSAGGTRRMALIHRCRYSSSSGITLAQPG